METKKFGFNIDRGGTFTDFYVQQFRNNVVVSEKVFKILSQSSQGQGPIVGIKRVLNQKQNGLIDSSLIQYINLGTTIATNALLQRKGCPNAMLLTKGFENLLQIRHQARPDIFDLSCKKYRILASKTFEINERIYLNNPSDILQYKKIKLNNEQKYIWTQIPRREDIKQIVNKLKQQKIQSIGVSFCNSYLYKQHEQLVAKWLIQQGMKYVEVGSRWQQQGYLKRSQTVSLDIFLNPIIKNYFTNFINSFTNPQHLKLRIMRSDGGFDSIDKVKPSQLLLSGPAGGVIACQQSLKLMAKCSNQNIDSAICLDMGGTSTDVSRICQQQIDVKYIFQAEGIQICTPHLNVQTIAAGGGSKLSFQDGLYVVGPQSVGANPGPVCYGIGNDLATTDANLMLNRLNVDLFPKIFGKNKNQPLNKEKTIKQFQNIASKIRQYYNKDIKIQQIAEGFVSTANQLMARSARKFFAKGTPSALMVFGSAGGQHCCDVARLLGLDKIFLHRYSGILSAYGLSKAKQSEQNKKFIGKIINKKKFNFQEFQKQINQYRKFKGQKNVKQWIGIGYKGTQFTLKMRLQANMFDNFEAQHKKINGFIINTHQLRIEYFLQIKTNESLYQKQQLQNIEQQIQDKYFVIQSDVFINGKYHKTPTFNIQQCKNCIFQGPALLVSSTTTILIQPSWKAKVSLKIIYIKKNKQKNQFSNTNQNKQIKKIQCQPVKLTLYSSRLMSIAQQMGRVLQKISISVNIRQRLDFSCGIFDSQGKLLANAPHLPVHLGSMQTAVIEQIKREIKVGQTVLTNHPQAGGSHLPDLTVVTSIQIDNVKLYLASRGHHSDIGGIAPGSMPAFSTKLSQQGVAVQSFVLLENAIFRQKQLRDLFKQSRKIQENVSDLLAQIAANQIGAKMIQYFIKQRGVEEFKAYVNFICENAAQSVRILLCDFSRQNKLDQVGSVQEQQKMDDGSSIKLKLTIDRLQRQAIFDFTGTSSQVLANINAPKSITRSAILYCLRSLIGRDIPLNSGCLRPLNIIIPQNTILNPSYEAAVAGGNVQTSQRIVDLVLKPFKKVASSQGTMNNFLFGNQKYSYYETICGGTGAGDGFNGTTNQCHMTNTRITDAETLEKHFPVILTQFKLRNNSGGKGRWKGGEGVIRQMMFLQRITVSILSERRVFSGYGIQQGEAGSKGKNTLINNKKIHINIGSKNTFTVQPFQSVRIQTPGGGGFGINCK